MTYTVLCCTPCNKNDWKLLQGLINGDERLRNSTLTPESHLFDHIREYKSLNDVPCCRVKA